MRQHFRVLARVKKPGVTDPMRFSEFVFSALRGCRVLRASLSDGGTLRTDFELTRSIRSLIPSKSNGESLGLDQYVTIAIEQRQDVELIQVVSTAVTGLSEHVDQILAGRKLRPA